MTRRPRTVTLATAHSSVLQHLVSTILDATSPSDLRAAYAARNPKKSQRRTMIAALTAAKITGASISGARVSPVTA